MKMLCALIQSRLARKSVEEARALPKPLERHTAKCAECRAFWEDMQRLQAALPQVLVQENPSSDFDDRLWARLQQAPPASPQGWRSSYSLPIATAAAALGVLAFGYYSVRERPGAESGYAKTSPPQERKRLVVALHQGERPPLIKVQDVAPPARRRHSPKRRRSAGKLKTPPPSKGYVVVKAPARPTWAQVGYYYAAYGEYQSAASAYARAYQQQGDPRLAFVAGQAAENAGDPIQALELFTHTLTSKPAPSDSERIRKEKHNETRSLLRPLRNCSAFERESEPSATIS